MHQLIVRTDERTGPRAYCQCGWASALHVGYGRMIEESYAHLGKPLDGPEIPEPVRMRVLPATQQPTLF